MVKSYDRYEQVKAFGVITSQSNVIWLQPSSTQSTKSAGRAISSGLEEILVWDIKTGEILQRLSEGLTPGASNSSTTSPPSPVSYLAYHELNNLVAAGYANGSIKVWDLASESVLVSFEGHKSGITKLVFDKSGTRLCSGSQDSTIILWDLVGEEGLFKLKGHKGPITGIEFLSTDPESKELDDLEDYILSSSRDGLLKLWDLKTRQCVETHLAHSNECWGLSVNSTRSLLVTSGNKDQVKLWHVDLSQPDNKKVSERGSFDKLSKSRCQEIAFKDLPNGIELFYIQNVDRTIEMFRVRSDDEMKKGIAKRIKRLTEKGFDEDEIMDSLRESEISMLIKPFATIRTIAKIKSCIIAGGSSNSKKSLDFLIGLANNSIEYHTVPLPEDDIKKANASDIHSIKKFSIDILGHRSDIRTIDVSDDDKLLATASNGELKIWNILTFKVIRSFVLEGGYALCCKFLPGGTLVVVGFKNGDLELYDLTSSSLVDSVQNAHGNNLETAAIWSMDLTPDGKTLVTGGNDKCVKFWNFKVVKDLIPGSTNSYATLMKFQHKQTLDLNEDVLCVKISPDAKYLAISLLNNNVQVVFMDSLKLFLTLYGHKLPVLSIDISHDSKLIITSSADKNIKIWGLDFGDCHKSIFGHQDSIMNVKFIPETHNFFSTGKDGLVKYWDGDKFECVQKLPAHQSEVWSLSVGYSGRYAITASHDNSIRLWKVSEDQVFLEEEREKEMDEMYENTLLDSLEADDVLPSKGGDEGDDEDQDMDDATRVSKQTMETLKAGEKLMEALDIGIEDVNNIEEYAAQLMAYNKKKSGTVPVKPTPNTILMAYGVTGQEYVLSVLLKIKAAQLDDALLVLPFSYTLKLLRMIQIWTNKDNITNNIVNMSLICKVLFFVIRSNAKELVAQKDPQIMNQLLLVKEQIRSQLAGAKTQLGVNTQGLRYIKQQWKLTHETQFIDENEQKEHDDKKAIKRSYATV
ncbi:uncharacterized protein KQ657_000876 [Scheffersomyces spartinae]|uniref:Small-subunit processome Utp12 domain-containing protein n=1 Tax=Scheffersomyces spartinae TaxID=45513 RepID=A0A9P7V921_9ASCO|nr:uncharacterized protein KQ657_000876 [Scheffersomyces spartinae]KAG7193457.1 hypothetical protein KQ657_000876 [Scheffersomyces spartinae]